MPPATLIAAPSKLSLFKVSGYSEAVFSLNRPSHHSQKSTMTIRSVILGIGGALLIAGFGYINDRFLRLESVNSGHLLPVIVMGFLLLAVLVVNPLLQKLRKVGTPFGPGELAFIVICGMVACSIPGRGLLEQFVETLVMPHHWYKVEPGWQGQKLMEYVPTGALVAATEENYDRVVNAFVTGAGAGRAASDTSTWDALQRLWRQVPWRAWMPPLATWLPMVFLSALCSICLALVVHRQWSRHELLPYPIALFSGALMERDEKTGQASVLHNRLFWMGLVAVLVIRLNNWGCRLRPDWFVPVRLDFSLAPLLRICPDVANVTFGMSTLTVQVFPLVIGFSFFLSSDIALTLGLTQIAWLLFAVPLTGLGVNLSGGNYILGGWSMWQRAGSWLMFALMLIYTGRHYYSTLAVQAVRNWRGRETPLEVWAFRGLCLGTAGLIFLVWNMGLTAPFAIGLVLLMLVLYLVISRISVETGLFFIQARWVPVTIMTAMFGVYALGPRGIMVCALFSILICVDPSQALMPYLINGLRIADLTKLKLARITGANAGVYVAGVMLAIVVTLMACYEHGVPAQYHWSFRRMPSSSFRILEREVIELRSKGLLEESRTGSGGMRLLRTRTKGRFLWAFWFGMIGVLVLSMLRMRVSWWPIHPVLLLLWVTYPMASTFSSFLIGWIAKGCVVRYGGEKMLRTVKPMAIGVISGELAAAFIIMVSGVIWMLVTGENPIPYRFFPR